MKNFAIRLSVLALAATGFASSTVISKTSRTSVVQSVTVGVVGSAACCKPSDPSKCGLD